MIYVFEKLDHYTRISIKNLTLMYVFTCTFKVINLKLWIQVEDLCPLHKNRSITLRYFIVFVIFFFFVVKYSYLWYITSRFFFICNVSVLNYPKVHSVDLRFLKALPATVPNFCDWRKRWTHIFSFYVILFTFTNFDKFLLNNIGQW